MEGKIIFEVGKDDMKKAFQEVLTDTLNESFYKQFSNILISTKAACEILGLSHSTLLTYVKEGRIKPVNETERYHKFDLSDVLKADLKKFSRVANLRLRRRS